MALSVEWFLGGLCRIEDIRPVKDDKSHMRVTFSMMGNSDDLIVPSDVISAFRVGDMVIASYTVRKISYSAQFGEQSYIRNAYEPSRLVMLRKPTKDEF